MCPGCVASALAVLVLTLAGCDKGPALVPVSGQVLIDGQPLKYGTVQVIPTEGRPAVGKLDTEGRFKLVTDEREGCVKGTHTVAISAVEPLSEYENREHAPAKYASALTSGLTVTIDGPKDDLKIELSWAGEKKSP